MSFADIDKDSLHCVLWQLTPSEACAVRATCRRLNDLVVRAQVYWYQHTYNANAMKRKVHIQRYDVNCLKSFGTHKTFMLFEEQYPELTGAANIAGNYHAAYHFCMRNKHLWGTLVGFQCNRHNHCKTITDVSIAPRLLTAAQQSKKGWFIFHYLFECFKRRRTKLARLKKYDQDGRIHLLESHTNRLMTIEAEITALQQEIDFLENFDQLQHDRKTCPFHRNKPETYTPKYMK